LSQGEAQVQRNRTRLNVNNKKPSLLRQKVPISPKRVRQRIGGQGKVKTGRSGIHTNNKKDRTTDNNPAEDKRMTVTTYRGGRNRCTA